MTRPSTHGAAVAVDIGGTFTDLVAYENATGALRVSKVLTDVADRARGVAHVIDAGEVTPQMLSGEFIHGTTAATNAVIEGTTARTALITTQGFRDALELMRGDRPLPVYDVNWRKHTLSWIDPAGHVTLGYRPVHVDPLTPESEGGISLKKIAPKARVY